MLDYDAFAARVVELLQLAWDGAVNPYDSLYDELGLDSLQAFELLVIVEALAGAAVPPPEIPEIFTMQDAYTYFESLHPAQ
jgi:acyl carrier protein